MEIGEFMLFCRDFKVPLKKTFLLELFKRSSENRKNMVNFSQFANIVDSLGKELVDARIKEIKDKLVEVEKLLEK
jgi:hypothetical protein